MVQKELIDIKILVDSALWESNVGNSVQVKKNYKFLLNYDWYHTVLKYSRGMQ